LFFSGFLKPGSASSILNGLEGLDLSIDSLQAQQAFSIPVKARAQS